MFTQPTQTASATARVERLKRTSARQLTRAHLALAARPQVAEQANRALEAMRAALAAQLGCAVAFRARTLESAVSPVGSLARSSGFALVDLSSLGVKAVLEVELPFLCALLERFSGGPGKAVAACRLTRIEEAAFGYLCLTALAASRGDEAFHRRFGARLLSLHLERNEILERVDCRARHVAFEVTATFGEATGLMRLLVPAQALQRGIEDVPPQESSTLEPEVLAAGIVARAFAGGASLDSADLDRLSPGDVVMFDGLKLQDGRLTGPGRLAAATFDLHGQFGDGGFELSRAENRAYPQELTMTQPLASSPASLSPLSVDLEVELTRIRLPLAELAKLKPGAVIPLHINASESVVLRVGDRGVARAELVEIEGEVGARILTLVP